MVGKISLNLRMFTAKPLLLLTLGYSNILVFYCTVINRKSTIDKYCNDPKFLDRKVWENSTDPDQTASRDTV